jgi:hypothetical protein
VSLEAGSPLLEVFVPRFGPGSPEAAELVLDRRNEEEVSAARDFRSMFVNRVLLVERTAAGRETGFWMVYCNASGQRVVGGQFWPGGFAPSARSEPAPSLGSPSHVRVDGRLRQVGAATVVHDGSGGQHSKAMVLWNGRYVMGLLSPKGDLTVTVGTTVHRWRVALR